MTIATRPVMRYHGGKWKLAPWVLSFFPAHRVYTEGFGGAGSVLMRKPRAYAEVYNDLDGEVVNVFRVLRDPASAAELDRLARLTPFSRAEFSLAYEPSDDPVERARRTIARAFMGFGSASQYAGHATGFRSNSDRSGLPPAGDWANWPLQITAYTERLRGVVIEERPAVDVLTQHDRSDALHYVDPPYVLTTRGSASGVRQKYRVEMTDDDHRHLAKTLRGLAGMVVLSGYPSALYDRELYADWARHERIALADSQAERTEVLWLNPRCSDALGNERAQLPLL